MTAVRTVATVATLCLASFAAADLVNAQPTNIALNPSRNGFPSPLQSDRGWGGGSDKWDLVDGLRSYNSWANGLAFTGGHRSSAGGPPWIEPAGVRGAIVDFGGPQWFDEVVVWHHGVEHTPLYPALAYWDGSGWIDIPFTRTYGTMYEPGSNSGYAHSDIYEFSGVTGSKVRYSFDNSGQNINGTFNIHGWIYEVEVFGGKTLGEKAAELAASVVSAPYLRGGKGWDYSASGYVEPAQIFQGYEYCGYNPSLGRCTFPTDQGVDCSGLVLWAYNKGYDAGAYLGPQNPIFYENADGQWRFNSAPIQNSDAEPGDLMFFDFNTDGFVDHVALYLGNDEVVHAQGQATGIVSTTATLLESSTGFMSYGRPVNPLVDFQVRAYSPVDLVVQDPDGFSITAQTMIVTELEILREVPGQLYYSELDVNGDGEIDDLVFSPHLKRGSYFIKVVPEPDAALTDTYSLDVVAAETVMTLAQNVVLDAAPENGYGVRVDEQGVSQFTPITISVIPTVNPRSQGRIPVAIPATGGFDPGTIDLDTLRFGPGGAVAVHATRGTNQDDLIVHFKLRDSGIQCGDAAVSLLGETLDGTPIGGIDSITTVGCNG